MNRFVIVDGLPYLLANGKTYSVRWDDSGFTVGAEVKLASVPKWDYSELSIMAQCQGRLDSMTVAERADEQETEQEKDPLDSMTVAELKEFAETNGIELGEATKKADILAAIKAAMDGEAE